MIQTIKFNDLRPEPWLRPLLDKAYQRVMDSGRYIGGAEVEAFEEEWAVYCGAKYCVACGNGFDAIQLVIRALSTSLEHVYVSPMTFIATWQAVRAAGKKALPLGWCGHINIDVHLYGIVHPVPEIKVGDWMFEDCAQAHGATYRGKKAGKQGNAAMWSFYPTKNLGCYGDGGAVTTDDPLLADIVRELRNYGDKRTGINSRMDPLQAAFLRAKLPYLHIWNHKRRVNARLYFERLSGCPGVTLPSVPEGSEPCWHQFAIRAERRDELKEYLSQNGIETLIHYPDHPYHMIYGESLPEADDWCAHTLSLPVAPSVLPTGAVYVAEKVREFYERREQ